MYNSRKKPFVSHVRGTELIVEYIEKHVCPTITSRDLLGKPAVRFEEDKRQHVVFVVSDDHYRADVTLPQFAQVLREKHGLHCTVAHGLDTSDIRGLEDLAAADAMVLFIRRLALPERQLEMVRGYLDAGKPLVALRTASHAFDVRGNAPEGHAEWRDFDPVVLGGSYHGHGGNREGTDVALVAAAAGHPILAGVEPDKWHSSGSLYFASPIDKQATPLLTGTAGGKTEPVAWTRTYKGGRVFYSSLGHWDDFQQPQFRTMLAGAIFWAMDRPVPKAQRH
jgi:type 1 glutamine amidotransferase